MKLLSLEFALLASIFIFFYWIIPFKRLSLLIFSNLVIYLLSDFKTLTILWLVIIYLQIIARAILGKSKKVASFYFALGIISLTLIFLTFRYTKSIKMLFGNFLEFSALSFIPLDIAMPLGLGFYIFNATSYLFYHYENFDKAKSSFRAPGLFELASYLGFFLTIITGPFMKAHNFFTQYRKEKVWRQGNINEALLLIPLGIFKKVVIASWAALHTNEVFNNFEGLSSAELLSNLGLYSIQIYADFSGYMDIIIGLGILLGYQIPKNFSYPYMAHNIVEFWQRWHITLVSFIKDYIYIPLAVKYLSQGNTKTRGKEKSVHLGDIKKDFPVNAILLFVAFTISGIWHGGDGYMLWALSHFLGMLIFMLFSIQKIPLRSIPLLSKLLTFAFISITWAFFALPTMSALSYLKAIFTSGFKLSDLKSLGIALLIFALYQFAGAFLESIRKYFYKATFAIKLAIFVLALFITIKLAPNHIPNFIYEKF